MLDCPAMVRVPALSAALVSCFLFAQELASAERWSTAEEWEDADLALFFTGELRGYVEPCG
jgi:hypothetical protein